jgi:putative membrane protein
MKTLIVTWLISAVSILIVGHIISGFEVQSFGSALIAAVVIGLINATIGLFLKIITFPLSILTFGIFLLVINALMLMFASSLLEGFTVTGFWAAFFGALVLAIINAVLRSLLSGD